MNTPELKRCPQCGSMDCGPIRCRFSMLDHVRRPDEQPAPAEAWVDVDELDADPLDNEPDPRWDEDQYLDDPRHGQAAGINRERGGRHD
jgi:hypothetical protein